MVYVRISANTSKFSSQNLNLIYVTLLNNEIQEAYGSHPVFGGFYEFRGSSQGNTKLEDLLDLTNSVAASVR